MVGVNLKDYYGDWAFDGGREPQIGDPIVFRDMIHYTMVKTTMFNGVTGDPIVFRDMIHYTMVKTTMFNGVTHPSIGIWNDDTGFRLVRKFGYEDYKGRMS